MCKRLCVCETVSVSVCACAYQGKVLLGFSFSEDCIVLYCDKCAYSLPIVKR